MDKNRKKILKKAKKFIHQAKKTGRSDLNVTVIGGETSWLHKVIDTQEKADFFMKMLKAQEPRKK